MFNEIETKKIIKKWGNSLIMLVSDLEKLKLKLKEGDIVSIKIKKDEE